MASFEAISQGLKREVKEKPRAAMRVKNSQS